MNKKEQEKIQRYIKGTARPSSESEEIEKLLRTRSNLRTRIDELRTRWRINERAFDKETDESMAAHLEETALAETESRLRKLGAQL